MHDPFPIAVGHLQAERFSEAVAVCGEILARAPQHVDALHLRGLALSRLDRHAEAVASIESSLRLRPQQPGALCNLGEVYRRMGRPADAEGPLRQALRLQPRFADAAFNLGNVLKDLERPDEAIAAYQAALEFRPKFAKAHLNLANTLRVEGRVPRAVAHYRAFLEIQPNEVEALISLASAQADLGEHEDALAICRNAAALAPGREEVDTALGNELVALGRADEAKPVFARLAARKPASLLRRLRALTPCPPVAPDAAFVDETRRQAVEMLRSLKEDTLPLDLKELQTSCAEPPMAWTYHGGDDRSLKEAYAALFADCIRPLELPRRTRKPRVGIVVTNGHEGVYLECLGRLVQRLSTKEMRVTVVCSRAGRNVLRHLSPDAAVDYFPLPDGVVDSAAALRDAGFDLLHYWEVGTDSTNYFLPFFQPAPVQTACWGWPSTTGNPRVARFVSTRWIEPGDGAAHYTEQLELFERIPTCYRRPPVPERPRGRAELGLPERGRVYLCTQNLRKYHPDFDAMLGDLLRLDPDGRVYAIEDSQRSITSQLKDRFARTLPDVAGRIVFLPRLDRAAYLHLVCAADLLLDTPHYGGGANSLYDAFACGTPVVTWPGPYHRGRFALGVCRAMDISETIAPRQSDYSALAVRIATERDLNADLRRRLRERSPDLFDDDAAVREHEAAFLRWIAECRAE